MPAVDSNSSILVQKFGGTSVASVKHIMHVAQTIIAAHDAGHRVVAVVSAMSGETDRLLSLARQITSVPEPRELDVIASTGEQTTAALTAIAITSMGRRARSFLGHQVKIETDFAHTDARIKVIDRQTILSALEANEIAILAGYQGVDDRGNITTLGRGGSDTTAVAIAAALHADACEIYTDVDGVYTADPRVCNTARRLDSVTYEQMLAFAALGAKVLAARCVALAMKYQIPIHVRSSFSAEPGTWIQDNGTQNGIIGIAYDKNIATVRIIGDDGQLDGAELTKTLAQNQIVTRQLQQQHLGSTAKSLSFLLKKSDLDRAIFLMRQSPFLARDSEVEVHGDLAKIAIVGANLQSNASVLARVIQVLDHLQIPVRALSTSTTDISCLVALEHLNDAICTLHNRVELATTKNENVVPIHNETSYS